MNELAKNRMKFATRFANWIILRRWYVIVGTVLAVVLASCGIFFLDFAANYRIFFDADDPQLLALEQLENTYGKSENVAFLIVPDDGNATSENALKATIWLTERAWQIPYSRRVDSLANFQHTTAEEDDLYVRDLVNPEELHNVEVRAQIREIALSDPRIAGSILALDGEVSVVNATVELSEEKQLQEIADITKFARATVAEFKETFADIDLRLVGTVIVNQTFLEASIQSQAIFLPTSLLLMALILWFLTRSASGVIVSGVVMLFSIFACIGIGGWVGVPFSPPIAPAPTIVLMIVVANCVHILVSIRRNLRNMASKHEAIVEAIRLNLVPVFLASLTTTLGFLSMNFSEVPPYRHLGMFVAFGISTCFVLSVTFLPAMLSLLPIRSAKARPEHSRFSMTKFCDFVLRHRIAIACSWLIIVVAMTYSLTRNELNDVLVHFFNKSIEFRQDTDFMDEHLSGNTLIEYSLQGTGEGDAIDPMFLEEVVRFTDWYRVQDRVRHVSSITDTFKQLNQSMHGDDPAYYRIPESKELVAQYLLLYELSLPQGLDLNNQLDNARASTRVSVSAETLNSAELIKLNERAKNWLTEKTTHIAAINGTGPATLFAYLGQRNIQAMLVGTMVVLIAISLILLFALRSFKIGLVSMIPNLLPAVLGFGVWGLLVGQVGLSLSVVVAMTIGIVVDDTVHFLSKYLRARREFKYNPEQSVQYAFDTAGRALVVTTVVLVGGFLILVFSPFVPTAQVGILTAMIIGFALVADLTLLPAVLTWVDRDSSSKLRLHP